MAEETASRRRSATRVKRTARVEVLAVEIKSWEDRDTHSVRPYAVVHYREAAGLPPVQATSWEPAAVESLKAVPKGDFLADIEIEELVVSRSVVALRRVPASAKG